eukprot:scaffold344_cov18-Tisochrysis_lutea.AAC.3
MLCSRSADFSSPIFNSTAQVPCPPLQGFRFAVPCPSLLEWSSPGGQQAALASAEQFQAAISRMKGIGGVQVGGESTHAVRAHRPCIPDRKQLNAQHAQAHQLLLIGGPFARVLSQAI